MLFLLLLLFAFFSLLCFYNFYYKRRHLPPGPTPLPLLGNLLSIKRSGSGEAMFKQWMHQYGPVYTYWIAEIPVVCVADYAEMVKLFQRDGDAFASRYNLPFERTISEGRILGHGILVSSGERWNASRKFTLHTFRDFGMGRNLMQQRILDDLDSMFAKIDSNEGAEEIDLLALIELAIGSIINNLLFGYKFEGQREGEFWELRRVMEAHLREYGGHSLLWMYMFWPHLLQNLPWFKQKREELEERVKWFHCYYEKRILERQAQIDLADTDSEPSDYVEAFLREKAKLDAERGEQHHFSLFQLGMVLFDMSITGLDTTTSVLGWGIALLLRNPHVVRRMEQELDRVVGSTRTTVTLDHRPGLPFTNAVVNEILRCANIAPQNFLRTTGRDVHLDNGFVLRKGTCIMPQISVVLCDQNVFPEPERFNPERFLDAEGRLVKCEHMIPFSIGKRQCLGESMARMELFLFVANLFNRYKISPGKVPPSLRRIPGAVVRNPHFTCRLEPRPQRTC